VGFRVREIGRVWLGGKKGRRGECSVFGGAVGGRLFVSGRTEVDRQKFPPHGGTSIFFFWRWNPQASAPITPGTQTDGFTMLPHQEPCVKEEPPRSTWCKFFHGFVMPRGRGGSSHSRFLMREHCKLGNPPGGGVSLNLLFIIFCGDGASLVANSFPAKSAKDRGLNFFESRVFIEN